MGASSLKGIQVSVNTSYFNMSYVIEIHAYKNMHIYTLTGVNM